ncbi:DUF4116 domain-containing protein [Burkholderia cepacia]
MDREQALETAKTDGWFLREKYGKAFRGDKEIVMAAMKNDSGVIANAHKKLRADREVMLEAVKASGLNLEYASDELKKDYELVLEAVKSHAYAIKYADPSLCANKEIMLEAVFRDGQLLSYASNDLKNDVDVVQTAIRDVDQHGDAYKYASHEMQCDKIIVMSFMWAGGSFIDIPDEVRDQYRRDKDVAKAAIISDARNSTHFYPDLFNDRDLMKAIFQGNGNTLSQFPQYQDDNELALVAVSSRGFSLKFVSDRLKNDPEIALIAIKDNYSAGEFVGDELFQQLKSVMPQDEYQPLCTIAYKREILHNAIPYLEDLVKAKKLSEKLDSELSQKPLTKAQQLSNDIESEGFVYQPTTTKAARTKL